VKHTSDRVSVSQEMSALHVSVYVSQHICVRESLAKLAKSSVPKHLCCTNAYIYLFR